MLMRDCKIDQMVFLEEPMDTEIRETFYRLTDAATCCRHGCIQGDPPIETDACPWERGAESYRPRFIRWSEEGFEYPIVSALPVKPISESRFYRYRHS